MEAPKRALDPRPAAQFIVDMARQHPGEITLVAVGPLGNLATALHLEPNLPKLIKQLYIMGGAAFVKGNVTPLAEANIWNDAHAAAKVFAADWELTMFGLDVTYDIPFEPDFVNILAEANPTLGSFVRDSSQFYMDFYSQGKDQRVCYFHDVFPLAYLVKPSLFTFTQGHAKVGFGELDRGQTSLALRGSTPSPIWLEAPLINVATGFDHTSLVELLIDTYAL